MSPWLKTVLLINILLCAGFFYASYSQWEIFRGHNVAGSNLITSTWNPFTVTFLFHNYTNGVFTSVEGLFTYPNTPFLLFFVSTIVNLLFLVLIVESKKKTRIS